LAVAAFLAAGAGAGAGAKAGWTWLTHSPRFAIQEVVVSAGERVSAAEVMTLADLRPGDNILGFRLSECVAGIEFHPWVKSAAVMRSLPDRVLIEVRERKPAALIALGAFYYVDEEGEVFKKALPGEDMNYPVLTGLTLREAVEERADVEPLIKLGIELVKLCGRSRDFPCSELSELHLDRSAGVTLVRAADGMRIRFGFEGFEEKWSRMERALLELREEAAKVAELDLNYEGRVTIRFREGYRVASASDPPEKK